MITARLKNGLFNPGFALLFFSSLLMLALRAPDAVRHPQFWAEDGAIFFQQQFGQGWPRLWEPYAGYLHLAPRFGAWLSSLLPYRYAPAIYISFAMLIEAWALAFFFKRSRLFVSPWILLSIYLLTPTNGEVFGTLTNIQWHLQFALLAATFYPADESRQTTPGPAWRCLLVLAMGLTGPFSIFCGAVVATAIAITIICHILHNKYPTCQVALQWWQRSDKSAIFALFLAAFVQAWFVLHAGNTIHSGTPSASSAAPLLSRDLQWYVLGQHPLPDFLFVGITLFIALFALHRTLRNPDLRWAIWLGLAAFATAQILAVSNDNNKTLINAANLTGDRYFLAIKLAWWAAIAMLLGYLPRLRGNLTPWPCLVPMTLVCLLILAYPRFVCRQTLSNLHWMKVSKQIDTGPYPLKLPINPEGWSISLSRPPHAENNQ